MRCLFRPVLIGLVAAMVVSVWVSVAAAAPSAGPRSKPNVGFKSGGYSVNENTTTAQVAITLSQKSLELLVVQFRTAGGSATGGASCGGAVDFINIAGQAVLFNPGQTQVNATVQICNDTLDEPNEGVVLQLFNPSNNLSLNNKAQVTLTINDDDPSVGLSVDDANADEGDSITFTVSLSAVSAQTAAVNWTTVANGSASAYNIGSLDNDCASLLDPDFVSASGALAFAPGETSKTVTITTCEDDTVEPDDTFTIVLSSPINATLTDGTGVGTIKNDDTDCTAGTEDFSSFAEDSQPTSFAGGTIDGPWGIGTGFDMGRIVVQDSSWFGTYAAGTEVLFTGIGTNAGFKMTFTDAIGSLSMDAQTNLATGGNTVTVTAYDAANVIVNTDSYITAAYEHGLVTVSSVTNNIKYIIVTTTDGGFNGGSGFTNMAWTCNP